MPAGFAPRALPRNRRAWLNTGESKGILARSRRPVMTMWLRGSMLSCAVGAALAVAVATPGAQQAAQPGGPAAPAVTSTCQASLGGAPGGGGRGGGGQGRGQQ